jgi:hypothetical protein
MVADAGKRLRVQRREIRPSEVRGLARKSDPAHQQTRHAADSNQSQGNLQPAHRRIESPQKSSRKAHQRTIQGFEVGV